MTKNIPYGLTPHVLMTEPNEIMEIYSGKFTLIDGDKSYIIEGKIHYQWRSNSKIIFQGDYLDKHIEYIHMCNIHSLRIGEERVANVSITSSTTGKSRTVKGCIINSLTMGVSYDYCDKICFSLFNMKHFYGDGIKYSEHSISRNRLSFSAENYEIIVENRRDYKEIEEKREFNTDEYYITHYCQITNGNAPIAFGKVLDILKCFSTFISFVYGKRYEPSFIYGYLDNSLIYQKHCSILMPTTSYVHSWSSKFKYESLQSSWRTFYSKWQEGYDTKDVLLTAIHWYIEANMGSGAMEGSYIMAFAGVELMYNVLIGEPQKRAEQKIKALCQLLQIDEDTICAKNISEMRNYLVHYGKENRAAYNKLSNIDEPFEQLLYLLERAILKFINFSGHISYRLNLESEIEIG